MNKLQMAFLGLTLPVVLLLSGCAVGATNSPVAPAPVAAQPSPVPIPATQKLLGEVVTYDDGLSVSVSLPTPYTPTPQAAGVVDGLVNLVFNVVITNDSSENVEISGFPQLNSGGAAASPISDFANNVGIGAYTTLLPGQSFSFQDAYSVVDQNDLTYLITPAFLYEQAIFTSTQLPTK